MASKKAKAPPYDWVKHWEREISAAEKALEPWRNSASKVLDAYRDERRTSVTESERKGARWNYFWASEQTQLAMMYGQVPKTNVDRRYSDADDDAARVAGEMLERVLNSDMQGNNDGMLNAIGLALFDFKLLDLGVARVRYEMDEGPVNTDASEDDGTGAPKADPAEQAEVTDERVLVEWVDTKRDFLWSAGARNWPEVRWIAFRAELTRDEDVRLFGKDVGRKLPMNVGTGKGKDEDDSDPRKRTEVFEIWSKEHGKCFWYVKGFPLLARGPEAPPLRLKGFWPVPEPMVLNGKTRPLMPRPSYAMAQDLYAELNELATRTKLLESAIRVAGVYDGTNEGLKSLLQPGAVENKLYPVDNWALHAERGGLKGAVDWFPLEMIVNALVQLQQRAEVVKAELYEITGHADVLRGESLGAGVTATDSRRATRMASVRLQHQQDRFARFASDLMRLRAEVLCEYVDPERLVERSNIMRTPDAELAPQAVELLKSGLADYRIEIRPESVSLQDFAEQKTEALEVLKGVTDFMQAGAMLAEKMGPQAMPFVLQLLQGSLSRVRGARWAEGVLDPAVAKAEQAAEAAANPQQQPDPEASKRQTLQMKGQMDLARIQAKSQADTQKAQVDVEAQRAIQAAQTEQNLIEEAGRARIKAESDLHKAMMQPKPAPGEGARQ